MKKNGLDVIQDTEIQHLDVAKQNNIYVKYSKNYLRVLEVISSLNCELIYK